MPSNSLAGNSAAARVRRRFSRQQLALSRRRAITLIVVLALAAGAVTWLVSRGDESFRAIPAMVTVRSGPAGDEPVRLDTTVYVPASATAADPAPAVLLAHGFGGDKNSVAASAKELAGKGYVVLTWSARGFGRSGGSISLDDPDYEVNDARRLLDRLAAMPEVLRDGPLDPRVGVVGGSYGGALALLLAGHDHRVDAVVPQITWNDLSRSFFPNSVSGATGADGGQSSTGGPAAADGPPAAGVFKKIWAGLFFGRGSGLGAGPSSEAVSSPSTSGVGSADSVAGAGKQPGEVQCGRFSAEICSLYLDVSANGRADARSVAALRRRSPIGVLNQIAAPTLLVQGQADSLFPLAEADANARGIAANGTPVRVAWYSGGHDAQGSESDSDRVKFLTLQWLDHYLRHTGAAPGNSFTYSVPGGLNVQTGRTSSAAYRSDSYPGIDGDQELRMPLTGEAQTIAVPPGGNPASISGIPGLGGIGSLVRGLSTDVPGQAATFKTAPLDHAVDIVGAPRIRIRAASPTGEAVLFVKLYDFGPDGQATLPQGLVAPVRLTGLPTTIADSGPVEVTLPAIAYRVEAGRRIGVVVSSSDFAYQLPILPGTYQVAVADSALVLPQVDGTALATTGSFWTRALIGLAAFLLIAGLAGSLLAGSRRRRQESAVESGFADTPLVIRELRKSYSGGFVAVKDISFSVEREQVLGLLGPNGAGKTTTLRMLMGLIHPTAGEILVFGHRVRPGAPVLSRLGSFVEGTGFLPHLSGIDNLLLYWRATGRPAIDARLDEALEIAGLGDAVNRKVKTYSQGMRQRLAIAQAMLGLPDLLVLDEPTNGLDPPQIAEMRRVLRRYATEGRTVLVSSHLLAEVEQTCTQVVVMHQGELVAAGTVEEITGDSASVLVGVDDPDRAMRVLADAPGVALVTRETDAVVVETAHGQSRAELVRHLVESGVGVDRVAPRRRLEDVFLALVGGDK